MKLTEKLRVWLIKKLGGHTEEELTEITDNLFLVEVLKRHKIQYENHVLKTVPIKCQTVVDEHRFDQYSSYRDEFYENYVVSPLCQQVANWLKERIIKRDSSVVKIDKRIDPMFGGNTIYTLRLNLTEVYPIFDELCTHETITEEEYNRRQSNGSLNNNTIYQLKDY